MQLSSFRRKLKREVDKVLAEPGLFRSNNWFNIWHAHVDWKSHGSESAEHRQAELRALFSLHCGICKRMSRFAKPYQQFISISQSDPGEDAVYLCSENPHTPFPLELKVDWQAKAPSWLAPHVQSAKQRVGRLRSKGRTAMYVIEDIGGRNLPV